MLTKCDANLQENKRMNLKVKKRFRKAPKVKFPLPEFKKELLTQQQIKFLKKYGIIKDD